MRPRRLGEKSLVIACSHSGNTPEVVEGCEIALAAGATVIAQTDNAGSKIDTGKWTTWVYPWGEGVPQAEVPAGISLSLAAELLDQQEGYADLADMYAGIAEMDKILPSAREKVNAELGDRFAKLCQEHEFFYILGSGPNFSQRMVLDAKEYGMEAVPASVRAYLDPVLFYAMNCELRAARGKVFDHDPDFRRYMGVVEY